MTAKDKWIAEKCLNLVHDAKKRYAASRYEKDETKSIQISCEADRLIDDVVEGLKTLLGWQ